jgi:(3,5-dihydroxyphenyl)acetyl-CoA 1,2-dioxygenase
MPSNAEAQNIGAMATLLAARLPDTAVADCFELTPWFDVVPGAAVELGADAARLAAFCEATDGLLARLPPKAQRSSVEEAAADLLKQRAHEARTRFLRVHVERVYRALTNDYRAFVRLDALVSSAASRFPGLLPSSMALQAERRLPQGEKEGLEVGQGLFLSQVLSHKRAGLHLLHAMLRPTPQAMSLLARFSGQDSIDLGSVRVERRGNAGHVILTNTAYLNAEDDSTVLPLETAIDLVLLDPMITVGVLRGGEVDHPKYLGRRVFNAGVNLTHLYYGRISLVDFFLVRELGLINKIYRGLSGPDFLPNEPEATDEKPWIAAVEAFAIGGGCQLLLVMDHVIAERDAYFSLPARKEGFIPGAANLRLPRLVGERLARQAILDERVFTAGSAEGAMLCDAVVEREEIEQAIDESVARLSEAGAVGAAANRKALRASQEPLDLFRRYMALYAREQALCHVSPELIRNLEQNWNAQSRRVKESDAT